VRYYAVLIVHLLLIAGVWAAPFIFNWKLVVPGMGIYALLASSIKYCPLTKLQFGHTKHGFYEYYINKLGIKISHAEANILTRYTIPGVIALTSIVWQIILGNRI
jgi:hypothetical protein